MSDGPRPEASPLTERAALPLEFYTRPADEVAPALLGKLLLVNRDGDLRAGRIVETEAYVGEADLACHASKGLTKRTATLFGPPGRAYVYLVYGVHDLFNAVCAPVGEPHAVLVRAVELLEAPPGTRGDGPGRLTKALGIEIADNGSALTAPPITIREGDDVTDVTVTTRVGVDYAGAWAAAPLRYYETSSRAVSRR